MSFKDGLKKILPPPVNSFNREIARVLEAIETDKTQQSQMERRLRDENAAMLKLLGTLQAEQDQRLNTLEECLQEQNRLLTSMQEAGIQNFAKIRDEIQTKCKDISENLERTRRQSIEARRHASEAVWAQIFNNTITNSTWLKDKTFSPGRWAVGYPYLYVMYRVLDEARPKHILELGLGQSTRMIAQYAAAFDDVEHIVVEHDQDWIDFFCKDLHMSDRTKIVRLDLEMQPYKEAEAVRVYKGFREKFKEHKFDFISIDAPLGSDMNLYSRIDLLNILPQCLLNRFVILIDDFDRIGEQHMKAEVCKILDESNIAYRSGQIVGAKKGAIIASQSLNFYCSM